MENRPLLDAPAPDPLTARGASQKLGKIGLQPADSTLTIALNTTYTTGC
jgi:hypothetical protein